MSNLEALVDHWLPESAHDKKLDEKIVLALIRVVAEVEALRVEASGQPVPRPTPPPQTTYPDSFDRKLGAFTIREKHGLVVLSIKTKLGKMGGKLSPVDIEELAGVFSCCPGAKMFTSHAIWHYLQPLMPRPCEREEMYTWR